MASFFIRRPIVKGGLYSVYTSKAIGFTALEDVAEGAALILMEGPENHSGKDYWFSAEVFTAHEVAETLTAATGHKFTATVRDAASLRIFVSRLESRLRQSREAPFFFSNSNQDVPFFGASVPGFPALRSYQNRNLAIAETHIFSPQTINQFRFGFSRLAGQGVAGGTLTDQDVNFTKLHSGDFASQTQAIGINNGELPDIVGFYTDNATGFTHGFLDANGAQSTVDDPEGSLPNVTAPAQNLLGINDFGKAAGFWTDNQGREHGFIVELDFQSPNASKFVEIPPSTFAGAIATQASNITDRDDVCGFWTDANHNNHGFFGRFGGVFYPLNVRIGGMAATSTSPSGCNNKGEVVGTFTDSSGNVHGFVYAYGKFRQYDAPGSSQTSAFGVMGTNINGVNDHGDFVGFFSDGTKVNGFVWFAPYLGSEN